MDEIGERVQALTEAIRRNEVYRRYLFLEAELKKDTDLKKQVDLFRKRSYELQESETDWFDAAERMEAEFREIQKIPMVQDYLEAELSVCRMIQEIMGTISEEIQIAEPEI